uniref:Axin n=1 Tax=Pinctada fucata TaxID=50426 RepID=A0A172B4B0_PINFU|nr:axin [Pinctada fucata]
MTTSKVCQFLSESGGNNFTETQPRPPVPGEENEITSNGGMSTRSSGSMKSHASNKSLTSNKSFGSNREVTNHSPAATPRRSAKDISVMAVSGCTEEESAPLGFEPEGSDSNSPPFHENGTPPYMKWAENLSCLLEDRDGVALFKAFLTQEGIGTNSVDFYFLINGIKQKVDNETKLIRLAYKKYVKSDKLPCISEETKRVIAEKMKKQMMDKTIFDSAQIEVEKYMENDEYPLFIKSDLYVQYIQKGGESPKSSNSSSGTNSARPMSMPLPTLPEDQELAEISVSSSLCGPPPCKSGASLRSDSARRNTNEAFSFPAPFVPPRNPPPHPYHVSYAPTSAQDSELQSLSSDAHTEDTLSVTDTSSVDNDPKFQKRYRKQMRRRAEQNRESGVHFIPRTDRAPKDRNIAETDPARFAAQLIEKLEKVLQERERDRRIEESLNRVYETDPEDTADKSFLSTSIARNNTSSTSIIHPLMTSTVIEDDPDSILEEHCSRIWESSAGQTPSRSPGRHSPTNLKPKSPDRTFGRKSLSQTQPLPSLPNTLPSQYSKMSHHKKRPDFYSSFDSGMGEDKPAVETHKHIHHHHHHHHSKPNKSVDYDAQKHMCYSDNSRLSDLSASERGRTPRRTNKRHSDASSNIDSGVSMIESIPPMPNPHDPSTEKVLNWMMENSREDSSSGRADSDRSSSHKNRSKSGAPALASSLPHKQQGSKKQSGQALYTRSGSIDRGLMPQWVPAQPFATDLSMPLLNPPNTTVQLEEAKRRLEERSVPVKSKSCGGIASKDTKKGSSQGTLRMSMSLTKASELDVSGDSGSTLEKKSAKRSSPSSANTSGGSGMEETVVGYFFCSEPIPYRLSFAGKHITLSQFKNLIGRKGSFKYFFKKKSNEFESEVVFEEIQDDSEVLPLWDGKIVAKVERVD